MTPREVVKRIFPEIKEETNYIIVDHAASKLYLLDDEESFKKGVSDFILNTLGSRADAEVRDVNTGNVLVIKGYGPW